MTDKNDEKSNTEPEDDFEDELWTPKMLAAHLHVQERTLTAYRSNGTGPPFLKIEGNVRYPKRKSLRWIADCEAISTAQALAKQNKKAAKNKQRPKKIPETPSNTDLKDGRMQE